MAPIGSGDIMRCDFVGVGVTLVEEECHCRGGGLRGVGGVA